MAIVGQNSLLNQYVPTFFIKDLRDGQTIRYDSTRKAFVNVNGSGGGGGFCAAVHSRIVAAGAGCSH